MTDLSLIIAFNNIINDKINIIMKRTAIILLTIAIALMVTSGIDAKVKHNRKVVPKRMLSIEAVKHAYINKVNSLVQFEYDGYFLTDITGDGIPELWVKYGTCEADYMLEVYTFDKSGLKRILSTGAGHTGYYGYRNDNYVIAQNAHMGYETLTRITYTGKKLHEKIIYRSPGEVRNYKQLREPYFEFIPFNNANAIYHLF